VSARFPLKKKRKKKKRKKKRGERKKRANAPLCVCAGSRVTWLHGYERCSRIGASAQSGDSCRANNGQRDGNRYGNPESRLVGRQDGREFPPDPDNRQPSSDSIVAIVATRIVSREGIKPVRGAFSALRVYYRPSASAADFSDFELIESRARARARIRSLEF